MARVTTQWSGLGGLPGFTNLYFDATVAAFDPIAAVQRVGELWDSCISHMPVGITFEVLGEIALIDSGTGIQSGQTSATLVTAGNAGGPGNYSAASGAVISWLTGGFHRGHKVRGRSFLVPLNGGAYSAQGALNTTVLSDFDLAAARYIFTSTHAGVPVVWARPTYQLDANGKPIKVNGVKQIAVAGAHFNVSGEVVHNKVAILRSRRD